MYLFLPQDVREKRDEKQTSKQSTRAREREEEEEKKQKNNNEKKKRNWQRAILQHTANSVHREPEGWSPLCGGLQMSRDLRKPRDVGIVMDSGACILARSTFPQLQSFVCSFSRMGCVCLN